MTYISVEEAVKAHVLKVELGELTRYHLTCNLPDSADCHRTCTTHPEGHDADDDGSACAFETYEHGCTIAEWVNDGGIEAVEFDHEIEIPVDYQWNASHDYPTLIPLRSLPAVPQTEVSSEIHSHIQTLRTVIEEEAETYTPEGMVIFLKSLLRDFEFLLSSPAVPQEEGPKETELYEIIERFAPIMDENDISDLSRMCRQYANVVYESRKLSEAALAEIEIEDAPAVPQEEGRKICSCGKWDDECAGWCAHDSSVPFAAVPQEEGPMPEVPCAHCGKPVGFSFQAAYWKGGTYHADGWDNCHDGSTLLGTFAAPADGKTWHPVAAVPQLEPRLTKECLDELIDKIRVRRNGGLWPIGTIVATELRDAILAVAPLPQPEMIECPTNHTRWDGKDWAGIHIYTGHGMFYTMPHCPDCGQPLPAQPEREGE